MNLSNALYFARQYEESARAIRHAMSLAPGRPASHYYLGLILLQQGRNDEALAEFNLESISWQRMFGRAFTFARTGKPDLARAEMAAITRPSATRRPISTRRSTRRWATVTKLSPRSPPRGGCTIQD